MTDPPNLRDVSKSIRSAVDNAQDLPLQTVLLEYLNDPVRQAQAQTEEAHADQVFRAVFHDRCNDQVHTHLRAFQQRLLIAVQPHSLDSDQLHRAIQHVQQYATQGIKRLEVQALTAIWSSRHTPGVVPEEIMEAFEATFEHWLVDEIMETLVMTAHDTFHENDFQAEPQAGPSHVPSSDSTPTVRKTSEPSSKGKKRKSGPSSRTTDDNADFNSSSMDVRNTQSPRARKVLIEAWGKRHYTSKGEQQALADLVELDRGQITGWVSSVFFFSAAIQG